MQPPRRLPAESLSLYERAIALLARREHSRVELARKLAARLSDEETPEAIEPVLDRLVSEKLLSDRRYAEVLGHSRAGRHGSLRLRQDLARSGVSEADAATALNEACAGDLAACRAVWLKKFGVFPIDLKDRARQTRFLLSRGFPAAAVAKVIGGRDNQE